MVNKRRVQNPHNLIVVGKHLERHAIVKKKKYVVSHKYAIGILYLYQTLKV